MDRPRLWLCPLHRRPPLTRHMFTPFKAKPAEVLNHWISFADQFQLAPSEFYDSLQKEIQARNVPGLETTQIEFAEGGALSPKRTYMRMLRERLVFDICAAPFGTGYFFSCRTAEIPVVVHLWQIVMVIVILFATMGLYWRVAGFFLGIALFVLSFFLLIYLFRNAVAMGLQDLDTTLLRSPVFGSIYEAWFRRETYYRQDTRLMYLDTVDRVVKKLAEEVTAARGVKLVRQYEWAPILGELYRPVPATVVPPVKPA